MPFTSDVMPFSHGIRLRLRGVFREELLFLRRAQRNEEERENAANESETED